MLDTSTSHSGGQYEIYVDGKLKQTYTDTNNAVGNLVVSNNGIDYAYITGTYGTDLVKDGKVIYSNTNIDADFSADLSTYIAATGLENDYYGVVVNGWQVASQIRNNGSAFASIALSENGQHYLYYDGHTLFEDGKAVANGGAFNSAIAVSDSGSFALDSPTLNTLNINGADETVTGQASPACNADCSELPLLAIDDSGEHYATGYQSGTQWNVDGQEVTIPGNIESVEFDGETLYVYVWED